MANMSFKNLKNMKHLLIFIFLLVGTTTFAHQIDLSTIILSKTENGKVVMQINSSMTAFQGEINYLNPKNSYKSPDDFRNLVIKHFLKNFSMILNEKDTLKFVNPIVILGHETKIVVEVTGIPKNVYSISLKNKLFKDIHDSESAVVFLLKGFPEKTHYELNDENNHELDIALIDSNWVTVVRNNPFSYLKYALYIGLIAVIGLLFYFIRKRKNSQSSASYDEFL